MRALGLLLAAVLCLPLACAIIAPAALPMATDGQIRLYALAVRELQEQRNLTLDYRLPLAIDAVRNGQDFTGISLDSVRATVAHFVQTITDPGAPCTDEDRDKRDDQTGWPCECWISGNPPETTCRLPDTERYELRPFEQVMDEFAFSDEQREQAAILAQVDLGELACTGGIPVEISFVWPVSSNVITSCFGARADPVHGGLGQHNGIDVAASHGAPIRAAHAGTVLLAQSAGIYGNLVILIAEDGQIHTWYAHLSEFAVAAGDRVLQGDTLGYVGNTGRSTGNHLHFEMRLNAGTQPVDPMTYYR